MLPVFVKEPLIVIGKIMAVIIGIWFIAVLVLMMTSPDVEPDGKGRTEQDIAAGRTATCHALRESAIFACTPFEKFEEKTIRVVAYPVVLILF